MSDAATANPVHDWIARSVSEHPVLLFMKGEPEQPRCGFSAVTVQILDHLGVRPLEPGVLLRRRGDLGDQLDHGLHPHRVRR